MNYIKNADVHLLGADDQRHCFSDDLGFKFGEASARKQHSEGSEDDVDNAIRADVSTPKPLDRCRQVDVCRLAIVSCVRACLFSPFFLAALFLVGKWALEKKLNIAVFRGVRNR